MIPPVEADEGTAIEKAFILGLEGSLDMAGACQNLKELIKELEKWIAEKKVRL